MKKLKPKNKAAIIRSYPTDEPAANVAKRVGCKVEYVYSVQSKANTDMKKVVRAASLKTARVQKVYQPFQPPSEPEVPIVSGQRRLKDLYTVMVDEVERRFIALAVNIGLRRAKQLLAETERTADEWLGIVSLPRRPG